MTKERLTIKDSFFFGVILTVVYEKVSLLLFCMKIDILFVFVIMKANDFLNASESDRSEWLMIQRFSWVNVDVFALDCLAWMEIIICQSYS